MHIRKYQTGEEKELYAIFFSSIHENASAFYSAPQLDAWAPEELDIEKWKKRIQGLNPFVVEEETLLLGYADLQANGYIDHFFVRGSNNRRGIGQLLMDRIHEEALIKGLKELTADVSLAAEMFFMKNGFSIVERKTVLLNGAELRNAKMMKNIR